MGKFLDFIMTDGNWYQTQKISMYREITKMLQNKNAMDKLSPSKLKRIQKIINE